MVIHRLIHRGEMVWKGLTRPFHSCTVRCMNTHHLHTTYHPTTHPRLTNARWEATPQHARRVAIRRRRFVVKATLVVALAFAFAFATSKAIDNKYAYSCPSMSVTVVSGDTLSEITERYCDGHALQASWDIANERGSSLVQVGDIITLGN